MASDIMWREKAGHTDNPMLAFSQGFDVSVLPLAPIEPAVIAAGGILPALRARVPTEQRRASDL